MSILLAEVCADRQADTWGAALQMVEEQGSLIKGLVEDMARNDEKSQKLVNLANAPSRKTPASAARQFVNLLCLLIPHL